MAPTAASSLPSRYYATTEAAPVDVTVRAVGGVLVIEGSAVSRAVPLAKVLPEHGPSPTFCLVLEDGARLQPPSRAAWAALLGQAVEEDENAATPTIVGAPVTQAADVPLCQRIGALPENAGGTSDGRAMAGPADTGSWTPLAVVLGAVVLLAAAAYVWAIPMAARAVLGLVPTTVDRAIGDLTFEAMDGRSLRPSVLAASQQTQLRDAFRRAVARADAGAVEETHVEFRAADMGPNAFALPGGRIVVTDDLVRLVDGREDVVVGVLGHEYGHVKARHGVRVIAQAALLRTLTSALFGDFSSLLAGAPALLGEQAYSRDFEREADAESVRLLRAGGYSPAAMVVFFERLAEKKLDNAGGLAIAVASHPADAERIRVFRQAAGQ